jgi:NTE family protein
MNVGPSARECERLSFLMKSPLERLTPHAEARYYSKGVRICGGQQLCEAAYLILGGGCELRRSLPDGQQQVLGNLGPGAAFGGLEKVEGEEVWTTVFTTADTIVLCLDREKLDSLRAESNSVVQGTGAAMTTVESGLSATGATTSATGTASSVTSPACSATASNATGTTRSERRRPPRQIVTLAFLSQHLPAATISEQLARSLCSETDANVVLVKFAAQDGGPVAAQPGLPTPEFFLNGEFHMPSRVNKTIGGYYSVTLGIKSTEPPSAAGMASLVSHLSRHFRHVLIESIPSDQPVPWLLDLLLQSDLGYLFLPPTPDAVSHLDTLIKEVCSVNGEGSFLPRAGSTASSRNCEINVVSAVRGATRTGQDVRPTSTTVQLKPIGCVPLGSPARGFDLLGPSMPCPFHLFVRDCAVAARPELPATAPFNTDIRRLAREIAGRLVGLALSSGAAKGFAHIGVIQVLEENGIDVDVVAGASMGAYVGSIWAYGCEGPELERVAREMESRWALWSLIDPVFPPRQGFLRGYAVKKRLMRSIGDSHFSELVRPLRVVAGNLATLERVVFSSGEVAEAVHASVAVPGICVPITIGGETYIDGGIVDPLPVDVLREMGVSRIIAVDVIPTPDRIRYGLQLERELAQSNVKPLRRFFRKALPLNQQLNYFAPGNLFEILMRSIQGAQIRVAEASCQMADIVLRPDIGSDRWADCAKPGGFISLGREIALRYLAEIKALVHRKESCYEREFTPESVAAID